MNRSGGVLICQRPEGKVAAGKWEFPGGKIEAGESAEQALRRELREELGIEVRAARPLIRVRHDYRDRTVLLDTWRVDAWSGEVRALDSQGLQWVAPARLGEWDLLAADVPIVRALQLPSCYVFTPPDASGEWLRARLARLPAGALLRLRLPALDEDRYAAAARELLPACRERGVTLLLDRAPALSESLAAGWHADGATLARLHARPVPAGCVFAASAHGRADLEHARRTGADCAVLGSVRSTPTHPGREPLGWEGFDAAAWEAGLPVYAIGGLGPAELPDAWAHRAQGVAGISAFWA